MIKCNECGLCKENCPVFRVVKKESVSPRGFAAMQKKGVFDKAMLLCSLCNNCKSVCPYGVDLRLGEMREYVLKNGGETAGTKEIIENLRKYGNPYGISVGL